MQFEETELRGAFVIDVDRLEDERGFFGYTFNSDDFAAHGLETRIVQENISYNARRNTLRGMHYQVAPDAQPKLIRCTQGAVYDVVIDLRPDSATHRNWIGVELTAENHRMIYVPAGFAHGFQTLQDHTELLYLMFAPYAPASARGVRWDDPAFGVEWPAADDRIINERDRTYSDYPPDKLSSTDQ